VRSPAAILLAALVLACLWPGGRARAEMVSTSITDETTQTVTEAQTSNRSVQVGVVQDVQVEGSAQADGSLYEALEGNTITEQGGDSMARIADGFAGATGIVSINQSPGNNNNQGNLVSFAYVQANGDLALIASGGAEVLNRDNVCDAADLTRTNVVEDNAFSDFSGMLQLNQSAGNLNNQNNILCIASGTNGVVSLSDAALGQQVARNVVREVNVIKHDVIANNAFCNVSGVISINQSSGCCNNQTNMIVVTVRQLQ
jgi:hypothetical protein